MGLISITSTPLNWNLKPVDVPGIAIVNPVRVNPVPVNAVLVATSRIHPLLRQVPINIGIGNRRETEVLSDLLHHRLGVFTQSDKINIKEPV
jgi:hypothetical protein